MKKLNEFIEMLCGKFDNNEQCIKEEKNCKVVNVKARHISGICNDKIINLPKDFQNFFVIGESYYEINAKILVHPHLFLFDVNEDGKIRLTSYKIPSEFKKEEFTNGNTSLKMDFKQLIISEKFTPLIYEDANGEFFGESVSFFSPVTKFTLNMKVTKDTMYLTEIFENNGKRMLGFDEPIVYNKILE